MWHVLRPVLLVAAAAVVPMPELVAVIGAGPSGLVVCKELKQAGYDPICFERQARVGGVFLWAWDTLQMTSSSAHTTFSDFPSKSPVTFWTKAEYLQYLEEYVDHFGIRRNIRLNTSVLEVKRTHREGGGGWTIRTSGARGDEAWTVSNLFICCGTHARPVSAPVPGQDRYTGRVMHTADYRTARAFSGQRVVLQGMGESGSDIALEIAKVAAQTHLSIRSRSGWVVPRLRERPDRPPLHTDLITGRVLWGMSRAAGPWLSKIMATMDSRSGDPVLRRMGEYNLSVLEHTKAAGASLGVFGAFGTKCNSFLVAVEQHGAQVRSAQPHCNTRALHKEVLFRSSAGGSRPIAGGYRPPVFGSFPTAGVYAPDFAHQRSANTSTTHRHDLTASCLRDFTRSTGRLRQITPLDCSGQTAMRGCAKRGGGGGARP